MKCKYFKNGKCNEEQREIDIDKLRKKKKGFVYISCPDNDCWLNNNSSGRFHKNLMEIEASGNISEYMKSLGFNRDGSPINEDKTKNKTIKTNSFRRIEMD